MRGLEVVAQAAEIRRARGHADDGYVAIGQVTLGDAASNGLKFETYRATLSVDGIERACLPAALGSAATGDAADLHDRIAFKGGLNSGEHVNASRDSPVAVRGGHRQIEPPTNRERLAFGNE
jgi:hypothetical protein